MAANEPADDVHSWVETQQSSDPDIDTRSLELGITGMSLVSGHERKETVSTLASSPPDDREARQPPTPTNIDQLSLKGSAPTSPSSDRQQASSSKGVSCPPGMSGPLPSPIAKPGHSKNTSATSPSLTLTPNSSVDGNPDWHSLGTKQSSPFHSSDAPFMPFLQPEHRRGGQGDDGVASLGSFDLVTDSDNDGLLGLEALRSRAHSSPGPVLSSSPPIARGHLSAHPSSSPHLKEAPLGDRARHVTRDRPPLSYSHQEASSNHQGDRSAGGIGFPSLSSSRSTGCVDANNVSLDSGDASWYGAIARPPELRQSQTEFDVNRRRASSSDNAQHNPYVLQQNGAPDPSVTSKFGTLPTLSSHIQLQRMPVSLPELQKPRHVRSVSQPMPANSDSAQQIPPGADSRYYIPAIQKEGHSYSGENRYKPHSSMSHPALSSSYEATSQFNQSKRSSMPNLSGGLGYGQSGYPSLQRRDALDYHMSAHHGHSGTVIASAEEVRVFGAPSMITPGHSPMQVHYGSHSRQGSDAGSGMHPSSPLSLGAVPRSGHMMHRRDMSGGSGIGDEDLAHPLLGENIDVPLEHDDLGLSSAYPGQGMRHGIARNPNHSHSMSLDQMLPQYVETQHHLPTAGASHPMPKVMFSVKFKRTQRNFVLGSRINRDLKIGTYVKVEADRGEDLGIVVGKIPSDRYSFSGRSSYTAGLGPSPGMGGGPGDLKRIIRLATHDEVSLLAIKREEEENLLNICREKVRQRGLPMNVVDAEYQFDRHKLTFFFEAEGRVDFRELVRDLFSMYKTRIWMQQLDKNTSTSAPAIVAPQTANMQMDFGTPIIAPVSEFADSIVMGSLPGDAR